MEPLIPPDNFPFPFEPYHIQSDLMTSLYKIIDQKQIGIFESPTGTGKSLSLTCGSLKWLTDQQARIRGDLIENIKKVEQNIDEQTVVNNSTADWITGQFEVKCMRDELYGLKEQQKCIQEFDQSIVDLKMRLSGKEPVGKRNNSPLKINLEPEPDEPPDGGTEDGQNDDDEFLVKEETALKPLDDIGDFLDMFTYTYHDSKIYYTSRTHSQLNQVLREIKTTDYRNTMSVVPLASRLNYCINPDIQSLQPKSLINERCLALQEKPKEKISSSQRDSEGVPIKQRKIAGSQKKLCPYIKQSGVHRTGEEALAAIHDIEELVAIGQAHGGCPYYASRLAAEQANVVLLPYQMLLHARTRTCMGINLRDSIVIIDEAHNLLDTIAAIHSCQVTLEQLTVAHQQLDIYKERYFHRFASYNLLQINKMIFVINRLRKVLDKRTANKSNPQCSTISVDELCSVGEFSNINLIELIDFCESRHLAVKVHGVWKLKSSEKNKVEPIQKTYLQLLSEKMLNSTGSTKQEQEVPKEELEQTSNSDPVALRPILSFFECLSNQPEDGCVLINRIIKSDSTVDSDSYFKFILLNPLGKFQALLDECRAIIVAGGTMQPTDQLKQQLFIGVKERVVERFYGHIVDKTAVLPLVVSKGPTGVPFLFNYQNRNSSRMLTDLSMTFRNICPLIPGGIVCFFGSYKYMNLIYDLLEKNGHLEAIRGKKVIFKEPRNSSDSDKMLIDYQKAATKPNSGALLFSVVGGKLSEGLNFSDNMGRCVIIVGLPYPNRDCAELKEKMKNLDQKIGPAAGSAYYENLCMKAVNQCIGRAVRHINDYAAVLLIDERYKLDRIKKRLPTWIARSLEEPERFGLINRSLVRFFKEKRH